MFQGSWRLSPLPFALRRHKAAPRICILGKFRVSPACVDAEPPGQQQTPLIRRAKTSSSTTHSDKLCLLVRIFYTRLSNALMKLYFAVCCLPRPPYPPLVFFQRYVTMQSPDFPLFLQVLSRAEVAKSKPEFVKNGLVGGWDVRFPPHSRWLTAPATGSRERLRFQFLWQKAGSSNRKTSFVLNFFCFDFFGSIFLNNFIDAFIAFSWYRVRS